MDEFEHADAMVDDAAQAGKKAAGSAKYAAKKAAGITKSAKKIFTGAAKVFFGSVKGKPLRTTLILILIPIILITSCLYVLGAAVMDFLIGAANYIVENNASYGNADLDYTVGLFIAAGSWIREQIQDNGSEQAKEMLRDAYYRQDGRALSSDSSDSGNLVLYEGYTDQELEDEIRMISDRDAAERVLQKRLNMVKRSAEARVAQYLALVAGNEIAGALKNQINVIGEWLSDSDLYTFEETNVEYNILDVSDYDAAAILCAYSAQMDQSLAEIDSLDLRLWLGQYSIIGTLSSSLPGSLTIECAEGSGQMSTEQIELTALAEDGSQTNVTTVNVNVMLDWYGTFLPQYKLEEARQDAQRAADTKDETLGEKYAKELADKHFFGRGLIDSLVTFDGIVSTVTFTKYDLSGLGEQIVDGVLEAFGLLWSWVPGVDAKVDIGQGTRVQITTNVNLRKHDPVEIVTNVIGLWSGDLDNYDRSTKNNRPFDESKDPNLLKRFWTDDYGHSYERLQGFQYEYWEDALACLAAEFNLGYANNGMAQAALYDGSGILAQANMIWDQYAGTPVGTARSYIWSEFHGYTSYSTAPWCCAFVYVCAKKAGYVGEGKCFGSVMMGNCDYSWDWFDEQGVTHRESNYVPHPGDLIYFTKGNKTSHIGIVESYSDGKVHTIEGNCGDVLGKNTYMAAPGSHCYGATYIWGYASPKYPDALNFSTTVSVYKNAQISPSPFVHKNYRGGTSYGYADVHQGQAKAIVEQYVKDLYPDIYHVFQLNGEDGGTDNFDEAWNAAVKVYPSFASIAVDGYYKLYGQTYFSAIQQATGIDFMSDPVLREFAWCVLIREGNNTAPAEIAHLIIDTESPVENIIGNYYTTKLQNIAYEEQNLAIRKAVTAILTKERALLESMLAQAQTQQN